MIGYRFNLPTVDSEILLILG